jgi:hypothetical protein
MERPPVKKSILIAAFILMLSSTGGAIEKTSVAVYDFVAKNVSQSESDVISEIFRNDIAKSNLLRVLNKTDMKDIMKEQAFQYTGCTDSSCAVELGKILSVRVIITGSVIKVGETYVLDVLATDVESGIIKSSIRTKFAKVEEFLDLSAPLAEEQSYKLSAQFVARIKVKPSSAKIKDMGSATVVKDEVSGGVREYCLITLEESLTVKLTAPDYEPYELKMNLAGGKANDFAVNDMVWKFASIDCRFKFDMMNPDMKPYIKYHLKDVELRQTGLITDTDNLDPDEILRSSFNVEVDGRKYTGSGMVFDPGTYKIKVESDYYEVNPSVKKVTLKKNDRLKVEFMCRYNDAYRKRLDREGEGKK